MATINYQFTLANTTGSQTIELVSVSSNTTISSITTSHTNGVVSGSFTVADNLVSPGVTYKLRITDGTAIQEGGSANLNCEVTYYDVTRCSDPNIVGILEYNGGNNLSPGVVVKATNNVCYTVIGVSSFNSPTAAYDYEEGDCTSCLSSGGQ